VASEPLHDIKGHLINLITELTSILPPGETKYKCTHLIDNCLVDPALRLNGMSVYLNVVTVATGNYYYKRLAHGF
jgi:hypothetical protein